MINNVKKIMNLFKEYVVESRGSYVLFKSKIHRLVIMTARNELKESQVFIYDKMNMAE